MNNNVVSLKSMNIVFKRIGFITQKEVAAKFTLIFGKQHLVSYYRLLAESTRKC